jgi:hypothetical protein
LELCQAFFLKNKSFLKNALLATAIALKLKPRVAIIDVTAFFVLNSAIGASAIVIVGFIACDKENRTKGNSDTDNSENNIFHFGLPLSFFCDYSIAHYRKIVNS